MSSMPRGGLTDTERAGLIETFDKAARRPLAQHRHGLDPGPVQRPVVARGQVAAYVAVALGPADGGVPQGLALPLDQGRRGVQRAGAAQGCREGRRVPAEPAALDDGAGVGPLGGDGRVGGVGQAGRQAALLDRELEARVEAA
jgi:hypothetical protein